eukprot:UN25170
MQQTTIKKIRNDNQNLKEQMEMYADKLKEEMIEENEREKFDSDISMNLGEADKMERDYQLKLQRERNELERDRKEIRLAGKILRGATHKSYSALMRRDTTKRDPSNNTPTKPQFTNAQSLKLTNNGSRKQIFTRNTSDGSQKKVLSPSSVVWQTSDSSVQTTPGMGTEPEQPYMIKQRT